MNSDHPKQTFVKMLGGIRAGPRGWDELGPQKTPKIWEGSEHIVWHDNKWTSRVTFLRGTASETERDYLLLRVCKSPKESQ